MSSFASSDFFGKSIFIGLFALSVMTWVIIVMKVYTARQSRQQSLSFFLNAKRAQRHPLTWEAPGEDPLTSNCFAAIYQLVKTHTVEVLNKNRNSPNSADKPVTLSATDLDLVEAHAQSAILLQSNYLESQLFLLSTTVSLAPFLGLLGTVWGILITFSELQHQVSGSANQAMMSGLSMALATTVLGLLVAIPALIGHNYLRNYIRSFTVEMEEFSTEILASIALQYRPN